jgi:NADPH:quinone reductase-like Zn-dependent oxidoreductase
LADLIQNGLVKPHIEKTFPAHQIPEAIGYIEAMRTKGKVAMVWEE